MTEIISTIVDYQKKLLYENKRGCVRTDTPSYRKLYVNRNLIIPIQLSKVVSRKCRSRHGLPLSPCL